MASWRCGFLVCVAALPLCATSIDVSLQPSVLLHTGDALRFTLSTGSYRAHTGSTPERFAFTLASSLFDSASDFTATLGSSAGDLAEDFGNVTVSTGYFRSQSYRGTVSTVSASINVSPEIAGVFSGPLAVLVLRNAGQDVTLGLPSYSLLQSLIVSLSGRGLTVGAAVTSAALEESAENPTLMGRFSPELSDSFGGSVPEPGAGVMLLTGGIVAGLLGRYGAKRTLRRRIATSTRQLGGKVCNPVRESDNI